MTCFFSKRCLENDHLVDVRIRHHEHRTIKVQASALEHISGSGSGHSNPPNGVVPATSTANQTRILPAHETGLTTPLLDLTPFDTTASMIFLFWLFARRLPSLHSDCDLRRPHRAHEGPDRHLGAYVTERDKQEIYRIGLIEAWRLGAWLDARCFQNDVLWLLARLLEREEVQAVRSADPHYSSAIAWARRAYDATTTPSAEDGGSEASGSSGSCNLRDFAVDVAAKRVYDVGMNGMTLSLKDREDLGANAAFAADVFASLGGQIGTRGVGVQELARQYLVEKVGEKE